MRSCSLDIFKLLDPANQFGDLGPANILGWGESWPEWARNKPFEDAKLFLRHSQAPPYLACQWGESWPGQHSRPTFQDSLNFDRKNVCSPDPRRGTTNILSNGGTKLAGKHRHSPVGWLALTVTDRGLGVWPGKFPLENFLVIDQDIDKMPGFLVVYLGFAAKFPKLRLADCVKLRDIAKHILGRERLGIFSGGNLVG